MAKLRQRQPTARTSDPARLLSWRDDPARFAVEALGYSPWSRQADLLTAVAHHDFVAIRSGHKCSKSTSLATLALWWVCTRPDGRAVFTAPTGRQVIKIVWPEVRKLYRGARYPLGGRLYETVDKGLRFADGRECFGMTTDATEAFAGLSGANLLFLVDEASGFPEPIFDAVFGNLAGGGKVVLAGNPTRTSGTFYDTFHSKRASWNTLHIASTETPNFHGGDIPGLATPAWAEWAKGQWGEGTPSWDVRVLGNFPGQAENTVIGLALIEAALDRYDDTPADGPLELGVDPARFGDDESAIVARRGLKVMHIEAWQGLDGPQLAAKVAQVVRTLRVKGERKAVVKIDPIGVGASPVDALAVYRDELEVVPVNVGEAATSEDYVRLRDQVWFGVRDWLASGGALPKNSKLEGELAAPTYSLDARNRMKVESKDDMRKRLKRSPDLADALALAIYNAPRLHVVAPKSRGSAYRLGGGAQRGF